jgi:hypothetical protein
VPDYTQEAIGYHLVLMDEAGLIRASTTTSFGEPSPSAVAERITWDGHELIANARNETVWRKVMAVVRDKGGSISFEVLKFMVVETAKSYFMPGQPTTLPPQP